VFSARLTDGFEAHLVDLPGYGFAARSKAEKGEWGPMIEGYLGTRINLRALCILVDVRRGPEQEELQIIEFMRERRVQSPRPVELLMVATKTDKIPANERKPALAKIKQQTDLAVLGFSSETGEGRRVLWERLKSAAL
jgi:GTP-binding protein